jgi:hypothetical protein
MVVNATRELLEVVRQAVYGLADLIFDSTHEFSPGLE